MPTEQKQLGQIRPQSSTAVQLYRPAQGVKATNLRVFIANNSATQRTFRIFNDNFGTTRNKDTALYYDVPVLANSTEHRSLGPLNNQSSEIAVSVGDASGSLTFTLFGTETTP
jgi:hypothetical protein